MGVEFDRGPAYRSHAKEYQRFCRMRGLFMVDGLQSWRAVLQRRGLSEAEVEQKVSAAAHFVKSMAEPGRQ